MANQRKIIIIGANAAGTDAAAAARKTDRKAKVTLIGKERWGAYSRCGLPFVLGGHIPSFKDLLVYSDRYYDMMKYDLRLKTEATAIDTKAKTVSIVNPEGHEENLQYDSLILATGSKPFVPPIKGIDKKGILPLHSLEDVQEIDAMIKNNAKSALVIGAGFLGLEAAVALVERQVKTTVVEMLPYVLPRLLDKDMANQAQRMFEERGLNVIVGSPVEEFKGDERVKTVVVAGEEMNVDFVINAAGVRANTTLAQNAGITIGPTRGIKTKLTMETNAQNVYAAGDCAETVNLITHRPMLPALGTVAVRQGKVAGVNAAGGYTIYPGSIGSAVTRMFDFEIGATGLNEFFAQRNGFDTVVGKIVSKSKADYYPGALQIRIKIVVDKESHRILGGQIIGGEEVTQRINALSFGIQKQMTIQELAKADTCYAPPLNETWEPMVLAAEMAVARIRR